MIKKTLSTIVIILIVGFLIFGVYNKSKEEENLSEKEIREQIIENIIKSTTAPNKEGREVSKELLDSTTAPNEGREVPKELLDSATAPNN